MMCSLVERGRSSRSVVGTCHGDRTDLLQRRNVNTHLAPLLQRDAVASFSRGWGAGEDDVDATPDDGSSRPTGAAGDDGAMSNFPSTAALQHERVDDYHDGWSGVGDVGDRRSMTSVRQTGT